MTESTDRREAPPNDVRGPESLLDLAATFERLADECDHGHVIMPVTMRNWVTLLRSQIPSGKPPPAVEALEILERVEKRLLELYEICPDTEPLETGIIWARNRVISAKKKLRAALSASPLASSPAPDLLDGERTRWQFAILDELMKQSGAPAHALDASGCDSGDALDYTLDQIGRAFRYKFEAEGASLQGGAADRVEPPDVHLVPWEGGEKVITLGGKAIGDTLTEKDGRIIRDWLRVAIREIWEDRAAAEGPAPSQGSQALNLGPWGLNERRDALNILRQVCEAHGDNDFPDDLHLGDAIEKHLWRHLEAQGDGKEVGPLPSVGEPKTALEEALRNLIAKCKAARDAGDQETLEEAFGEIDDAMDDAQEVLEDLEAERSGAPEPAPGEGSNQVTGCMTCGERFIDPNNHTCASAKGGEAGAQAVDLEAANLELRRRLAVAEKGWSDTLARLRGQGNPQVTSHWTKDRPCPWCKSCGIPAEHHKEGWYVTGSDGKPCKEFIPWNPQGTEEAWGPEAAAKALAKLQEGQGNGLDVEGAPCDAKSPGNGYECQLKRGHAGGHIHDNRIVSVKWGNTAPQGRPQ